MPSNPYTRVRPPCIETSPRVFALHFGLIIKWLKSSLRKQSWRALYFEVLWCCARWSCSVRSGIFISMRMWTRFCRKVWNILDFTLTHASRVSIASVLQRPLDYTLRMNIAITISIRKNESSVWTNGEFESPCCWLSSKEPNKMPSWCMRCSRSIKSTTYSWLTWISVAFRMLWFVQTHFLFEIACGVCFMRE